MIRQRIVRGVATSVSSLGLVLGFAGGAAATSNNNGSIYRTGSDSSNVIRTVNRNRTRVRNDNDVSLVNHNPQSAYSGDVGQYRNTEGGDATSGAATNHSTVRATVNVDNSSATRSHSYGGSNHNGGSGSISTTGYNSDNRITTRNTNSVTVNNDNDIEISNDNSQQAYSGDVVSAHNTSAGDVTSGDATNTSDSTFTVNVTN